MSLGDILAYGLVVFLIALIGGLFCFLIMLGVAARLRRVTGRENAVTRFFKSGYPLGH
jgi:hypothetical protein